MTDVGVLILTKKTVCLMNSTTVRLYNSRQKHLTFKKQQNIAYFHREVILIRNTKLLNKQDEATSQ